MVLDSGTPFPGAAALLPVLGTAAVIFCGSVQRPLGPTRLLSVPVLQHLGLISYSLYLVHWPLLIVPAEALGRELSTGERLALGVGLALPLAVLLHRFVEVPARSARALVCRPPRLTLNATAAVTVVLALLLAGAVDRAQSGPIAGGSVTPAAPSTPTAPPRGTGVVPANLTPSLRQVDQDVPDVYDRPGCHLDTAVATVQDCRFGRRGAATRVALFGDSHAAQWLPALQRLAAEGGALEIETYTKSSCPSVGVTTVLKGVAYASCDRWRTAVTAHLTADAPDVVVLSNYAYHQLLGAPGPAERTREWTGGLARTVDQLHRSGSRVVVVADTPRFDVAPPVCLSAHLDDVSPCLGDPQVNLDRPLAAAERRATVDAGGEFVDATAYLCDRRSCPPIVGDLLVYRDVNHLTATYARYLAPVLARAVLP